MEKYNLDELKFLWEKAALQFLYDLQLYNCNNKNSLHKMSNDNLNPVHFE